MHIGALGLPRTGFSRERGRSNICRERSGAHRTYTENGIKTAIPHQYISLAYTREGTLRVRLVRTALAQDDASADRDLIAKIALMQDAENFS